MPDKCITARRTIKVLPKKYDVDIRFFYVPGVHPVTGRKITQCNRLIMDIGIVYPWMAESGNYFGRMAQGDLKIGTNGKNAFLLGFSYNN